MTGTQLAATLVLVGVVALSWWGMRRGWEHRRRRTAEVVGALPTRPADLGATRFGPVAAVYVSTTTAGDWLDRVVAADLGVRSPATVTVHDAGLLVERTGATDLFVPAAALRAVTTAPGIAGKVVGGHGLVVVTWQPPGADADTDAQAGGLDTGLLTRDHDDRDPLVDAVATLVTPTGDGAARSKENA
ncbi:PH-like domain-containing protein [Cellulomonas composti]|uniref:PH domain-containing protein n=1 Tax=Cellulomonas composti TaxID=266130 RepID=A0A511J721_9CELL|nr:hypothetical protein [Cellulomonas composti]GEL93503.1 hypothetical protein CCO02nite_01610 [Cellulomonas composti]